MINSSIYKLRRRISTIFHNGNIPYNFLNNAAIRKKYITETKERVAGRRLIFCINPGRAGSGYLANLLNLAPGVFGCHEPVPQMNGIYLLKVMRAPLEESYLTRQVKLIGINRQILSLPENVIYAESNHMFIKTFFDVVADYYPGIEVIILRRDLRKIIKSFVEFGYFSNINPHWKLWLHIPGSKNYAVLPIKSYEKMDIYDRIIAYLIDMEGRAESFKKKYPAIPQHNIRLEDISTVEGANLFFKSLGIDYEVTDEILSRIDKNDRTKIKGYIGNKTSLQYCEERLKLYLSTAALMQIELPKHLRMYLE